MDQQKNILDHLIPKNVETPNEEYFKDLANKIVKEVPKEEAVIRVLNWQRIIAIGLTSAAILILGLILINQTEEKSMTKNLSTSLSELKQSEIENYIIENQTNFERDSIIEEMEIEEKISMENNESSAQDLEQLFSALTLKEIDQYFKAEGIDPEEPEDDELLY